jgi:CHAD domain-containing protein
MSQPPSVNREREVKLEASTEFVLPRLDGLDGLRLLADDSVDLDADYYDTDDLRLTRAGLSLRYRSDDGWTVKVPNAPAARALDRSEITIPGPRGEPPEEARDLVRAWTRDAPVRKVAHVRTKRRRVRLGRRPGVADVEVADDRVTGSAFTAQQSQFREIEVELGAGAHRKAGKVVESRLRSAGARTGDDLPKVARVLGKRATAPSDAAPPGKLGERSTVHDLVQAAIASSLHRLVTHDAGVRLGEDPEAVHQARVATRRLRSDLRTLRPVTDRAITDPLRDELKWLGSRLGAVRDADVLAHLLKGELELLGETDTAPARSLLQELERQRAAARDELMDAMRSERYRALLDRLVAAARRPPVLPDAARKVASKIAPGLVRRPWHRLDREVKHLSSAPPDTELHEVRKLAKQARYAAEAVTPVSGAPARRFAKAIERVQEVLGEHQDAVLARGWLRDAARKSDDNEVVLLAGELAGVGAATRRARREAWPGVWRRARRKKLRRWL